MRTDAPETVAELLERFLDELFLPEDIERPAPVEDFGRGRHPLEHPCVRYVIQRPLQGRARTFRQLAEQLPERPQGVPELPLHAPLGLAVSIVLQGVVGRAFSPPRGIEAPVLQLLQALVDVALVP